MYFKILSVLSVLSIASILDIKKRHVSNKFWILSTIFLSPLIIADLYLYGVWYRFLWLYSLMFTFFLCYFFWKLNFFGGGDAKCLLFLSFVFPFLVNVPSIFYFDNYAFKIYLTLKSVLPVPIMILFLSSVFRLFVLKRSCPFIPFIFVSFIVLILVG